MLAHTPFHTCFLGHIWIHILFFGGGAYFGSAILKLIDQQDRKKPKRAVWVEESKKPEEETCFSAADIRPQMVQLQIEGKKKLLESNNSFYSGPDQKMQKPTSVHNPRARCHCDCRKTLMKPPDWLGVEPVHTSVLGRSHITLPPTALLSLRM